EWSWGRAAAGLPPARRRAAEPIQSQLTPTFASCLYPSLSVTSLTGVQDIRLHLSFSFGPHPRPLSQPLGEGRPGTRAAGAGRGSAPPRPAFGRGGRGVRACRPDN